MFAKLKEARTQRAIKIGNIEVIGGVGYLSVLEDSVTHNPYGFIRDYANTAYYTTDNLPGEDTYDKMDTYILGCFIATKNVELPQAEFRLEAHHLLGAMLYTPWSTSMAKDEGARVSKYHKFWQKMKILPEDLEGLRQYFANRAAKMDVKLTEAQLKDTELVKELSALTKLPSDQLTRWHLEGMVCEMKALPKAIFAGEDGSWIASEILPAGDLIKALQTLNPTQKKDLITCIAAVSKTIIVAIVRSALFAHLACVARSGTVTTNWVTKRWALVVKATGTISGVANYTLAPTPNALLQMRNMFYNDATADDLKLSLFSTHSILVTLQMEEYMRWIIQQSKGQNLMGLTSVADMVIKFPLAGYDALSRFPTLKPQFVSVVLALCAAIEDPLMGLQTNTHPVANFADLAYIGYALTIATPNAGGVFGAGGANVMRSKIKMPENSLEAIIRRIRDEAAGESAELLTVGSMASWKGIAGTVERNNPLFFTEDPTVAAVKIWTATRLVEREASATGVAFKNLCLKYSAAIAQSIFPNATTAAGAVTYTLGAPVQTSAEENRLLQELAGVQATNAARAYTFNNLKHIVHSVDKP